MSQDLERRLTRLEDTLAIQQLFVDYAAYLDAGEFNRYAQLFMDDAELQLGPLGSAKGRVAIEALMVKQLGDQVGQSYHIISNPLLTITADTAVSNVMWTVILRGADQQPVLGMVGRHRDKLVKHKGSWLFQQRRGYVDIPSRMASA